MCCSLYKELYNYWEREQESKEIQSLPEDFFDRLVTYRRKLHSDLGDSEDNSLKNRLLHEEEKKSRRLISDVLEIRLQKIFNQLFGGKAIESNNLTGHEREIVKNLDASLGAVHKLITTVCNGTTEAKIEKEDQRKPIKEIVRFVMEAPAIIGADTKVYGPFRKEDVASLPTENADSFIKHGIAKKVNPQ